jgi:hypothetical protein
MQCYRAGLRSVQSGMRLFSRCARRSASTRQLKTARQRLTQQEMEQAHTLRVRCPAAFAAVSAPAADDQRWCRMEAVLQQATTAVAGLQQGAGREPTGQGAARQGTTAHGAGQRQHRCYRCGSATHMWRESPHPCVAGCAVKWCTML